MSSPLTIQGGTSAYLANGADQNTNFGSGQTLLCGSVFSAGNTIYNRPIVRFPITDLPSGAAVSGPRLMTSQWSRPYLGSFQRMRA